MVKISTQAHPNYELIAVSGEIDASSSIELDNAIKQASETGRHILIDLKELDYISSAGLGVFISYLDDLKKNQTQMVLFGLQEKVADVFEILGLQHLIKIVDSLDLAVESCG